MHGPGVQELMSRRVAAESQLRDPSALSLLTMLSTCIIFGCLDLPVEVDNFHTLVPLELLADPSRVSMLGWPVATGRVLIATP